jgi:hypothetical protein
MCQAHHRSYHTSGHQTFEILYDLDLTALAKEFARRSPDLKMRLAMKETAS